MDNNNDNNNENMVSFMTMFLWIFFNKSDHRQEILNFIRNNNNITSNHYGINLYRWNTMFKDSTEYENIKPVWLSKKVTNNNNNDNDDYKLEDVIDKDDNEKETEIHKGRRIDAEKNIILDAMMSFLLKRSYYHSSIGLVEFQVLMDFCINHLKISLSKLEMFNKTLNNFVESDEGNDILNKKRISDSIKYIFDYHRKVENILRINFRCSFGKVQCSYVENFYDIAISIGMPRIDNISNSNKRQKLDDDE